MNVENNYDMKNFDKYSNVYAIEIKTIPIIKKIDHNDNETLEQLKLSVNNYNIYRHLEYANSYIVFIGLKYKLLPVYGHMYNDANIMLAKYLHNKDTLGMHLIKFKDILKNKYNTVIMFNTLNELLKVLPHLKYHYKDEELIKEYSKEYENSNMYIKI